MDRFGRAVLHLRVAVGLAAVFGVALVIEAWMRLGVLPWHRRGSESWHRTWNRVVRTWGVWTTRVATTFLGLRIEVRGNVPASGRYLVVANHQSSLDIPFLIDILRPLNLKFVAHGGLEYGKPAVSLGLRNGGFAFVHKTNPREDLLRLRRFAASLEENHGSPAIFPEGIRCHDGSVGPFGIAGTRTIRERTGLPILPVVHDGLWKARTIREVHRLVGSTIRVLILDPVPPERFATHPKTVYREIEDAIRDGLDSMRAEAEETPRPEIEPRTATVR